MSSSSTNADAYMSREKSVALKELCKTYKSLLTKWHVDRHHRHHGSVGDHKFKISGPKLLSRTISNSTPTATLNFAKSPPFHHSGNEEFVISSPTLLARTTGQITPLPTPNMSASRKISTKPPPSNDDDDDFHISSPTLLARATSQISALVSTSSPLASASNVHKEGPLSAGNTPKAKVLSPRHMTPIFFSQSGVRRKPPPVEKKLECSLEELCFGCVKKINITRDALSSSGLIVQEEEVLTIKVNPGWRKGTQIIFEGKGDERPGSLPADIVFEIEEKEHPLYARMGDDLELGVEVPLVQALTGCSMWVPVPGGGQAEINIEEEVIHPGYEVVVEGHGMPRHKEVEGGKRGDLRLKFMVEFPEELAEEQRAEAAQILEQCCY